MTPAEILAARARDLARAPAAADAGGTWLEVVTFSTARERYALETSAVREVARPGDVAPVPGAPDFVTGMINLRGEILPAVDLRRFLGIPSTAAPAGARAVIAGTDRAEFGILADDVGEVARIRKEDLRDPPASPGGVRRELVHGLTADAVVVLNARALLDDARLVAGGDAGVETSGGGHNG